MDGNDLGRMLLDAHRTLSAELDAALEERGYPDVRPGHAVVFLTVDRRSGSRLTDLALRAGVSKRLTAKGRRCAGECRRAVQSLETRTRRALGQRAYATLRSSLESLAGHERADEPG